MKKLLSMIMAFCLLSFLLPGVSTAAPVEIHLVRACFNLPEPDPAQVQKVEDAINAYIADRINVRIRLTDLGSDGYGAKVEPMLENREINLLWTASWEDVIGTNDLVAHGAPYDITDLLPGTTLYQSISERQWSETRYNGRNYFIPVYKDNVEGYDIMFRQEMVDRHGWDIYSVHSLADLEPMLKDAKADGLKYPYLAQNTAMFYRWYIDRFDFFTADARTNFVAVDRETNEVVNTVQTPEYAEFAKLMGSWGEKGYISKDDLNRVTTDTTTKTKDWAVSWWTDVPVNAEADRRYEQDVTMVRATGRYAHSSSPLGSCYCVTENSTPAQAQAAIDFLGLLYTDSALADLYTFGIEGEDFEYSQTPDQAIRHVTQNSSKYNHSMWESASATIVTPLDNEPDNKADLYVDFNGGAPTSVAAGFRFDQTPVADIYNACREICNEYGFALENGGVPAREVEQKIAEYQKALDDAGYQQMLAEFQQQYRAWKEQNQ